MAGKKKETAGTIKVKQIGSPIRRDGIQRLYLKSLGLGKINRVRELQDTPAVRGLITRLQHMVTVVE
ncbi:50S ribosomal protein L30 [Candidatus Odyssella acanthamoebae]|uniref:Large ribosomal subunit protein uL30 n=1 Tax=Candidatus Odyssella acanthamoebae TaxID=91604 RepID=A0A077AXM2_9PROT|nr:50S ribosomal protein L30 [Candidatus Paracaedibacter acanthamoebae]AIK96749.1 50S ribosomal protein L30 [Candidatus Paracaedibacter acanthamoebae]